MDRGNFLFDPALAGNSARRNSPARFTPADAPPAASNRALKRAWAAEANSVLCSTGDPDAARRAGAEMLVAALDCDDIAFQAGRVTGAHNSVSLSIPAKRRERNLDGAADRSAEAILAGGRP